MAGNLYLPGPTDSTVRAANGAVVAVPAGWILVPPGDPGLTRRVKAAGDHWVVQQKVGRRTFSRGVWADRATVERIRAELESERSTEAYAKRQASAARRRDAEQAEYVEDFSAAVRPSLGFTSGMPRWPSVSLRPSRRTPPRSAVARWPAPNGSPLNGGPKRP